MYKRYNHRKAHFSFHPKTLKDAAALSSGNIALWFTIAAIILGYAVFLSEPHGDSKLDIGLRKIRTGDRYIYAATVEHSGTTLKSIAREFIPDVNPAVGAEMIKKRNGLESIDKPLPIGQMVRLPENLIDDYDH